MSFLFAETKAPPAVTILTVGRSDHIVEATIEGASDTLVQQDGIAVGFPVFLFV